MYLAAIHTKGRNIDHDASKPYAVVHVDREGKIHSVVNRYASYSGACVACGWISKKKEIGYGRILGNS